MNAITTDQLSPQATTNWIGIAAVTCLAYVVPDLLHELAHAAATLLPLGVTAVSISTIGLSSTGSSAVVALAGPLANVVLSVTMALAFASAMSPSWRFFGWLFGTVNLFNATIYPFYSALLGSGDWAVVLNALAQPWLWRPAAGIAGLGLYVASIYLSMTALRRLVAAGIVAEANVDPYCTGAYWIGGALITAGAVFNPISPWFILTSGAAAGFGAMLGLFALPPLLRRRGADAGPTRESLRINWAWTLAGVAAAAIFLGIFGPGLRLAA